MAVLAAVGMGLGLLGAMDQKDALKDSARYNSAQAEEDIKLIKLSEKNAITQSRFQGAADLANIESAAVAGGVSVSSGSALDAIRFQAEQNSKNEFAAQLESQVAIQNRRSGAKLETIRARNEGTGIMLGAAGQAISTGTQYAAARR